MLLKNLKIWDGLSDSIDAGRDVLAIEDGKISLLTSSDQIRSTEARDMGGLTLIPGLIDAHVHMCLDPEIKSPGDQELEKEAAMKSMARRASQMLAAGITTARDLGGGNWYELELRDLIHKGDLPGPRLLCAGQPITSTKGHCHFWGGEAADTGDILEVIQRQLDHGVDLIKVMATGGAMTTGSDPSLAQFDLETLKTIVGQATKHHRCVAAHCHGTQGIGYAAEAGVTTIEHCSWVGKEGWGRQFDEAVAEKIAQSNVWVSPTINAGWKRHIGRGEYENMIMGNYKKLKKAGVKLIASTDAGIPNVFHHHLPKALPVFAHFAGLSPLEVLKSATSDCAAAIGLGEVTGRIAEGYSADFVLYENNPLENLQELEKPVSVYAKGVENT